MAQTMILILNLNNGTTHRFSSQYENFYEAVNTLLSQKYFTADKGEIILIHAISTIERYESPKVVEDNNSMPLIVANLFGEDFERFHKARIPYSGSTGQGATTASHGPRAPYIATTVSELQKVLQALGWDAYGFQVEYQSDQWIVNRKKQ